jgi:hypothetical protein
MRQLLQVPQPAMTKESALARIAELKTRNEYLVKHGQVTTHSLSSRSPPTNSTSHTAVLNVFARLQSCSAQNAFYLVRYAFFDFDFFCLLLCRHLASVQERLEQKQEKTKVARRASTTLHSTPQTDELSAVLQAVPVDKTNVIKYWETEALSVPAACVLPTLFTCDCAGCVYPRLRLLCVSATALVVCLRLRLFMRVREENRHVSSYVASPLDPHARTARRTRRWRSFCIHEPLPTHFHPLTPTHSPITPTHTDPLDHHAHSGSRHTKDMLAALRFQQEAMVQTRHGHRGLLLSKKSRLESSPSSIALPTDMTSFCVCVLSHWVHAATGEGPDMPALKCSSQAYLGLYIWHLAI